MAVMWKNIMSQPELSFRPTFTAAIDVMMDNPNFATILNKQIGLQYLDDKYRNNSSWRLLPEVLIKMHEGSALPKGSPYTSVFNKL